MAPNLAVAKGSEAAQTKAEVMGNEYSTILEDPMPRITPLMELILTGLGFGDLRSDIIYHGSVSSPYELALLYMEFHHPNECLWIEDVNRPNMVPMIRGDLGHRAVPLSAAEWRRVIGFLLLYFLDMPTEDKNQQMAHQAQSFVRRFGLITNRINQGLVDAVDTKLSAVMEEYTPIDIVGIAAGPGPATTAALEATLVESQNKFLKGKLLGALRQYYRHETGLAYMDKFLKRVMREAQNQRSRLYDTRREVSMDDRTESMPGH